MNRQSNFELLRIVAMFLIVMYHLLLSSSAMPCYDYEEVMGQACWIPLHIAVVLFVLISGYFHIKASTRGIVKLILPVFVYYVPIELFCDILDYGGVKKIIQTLLFINFTPYWFIRTYLLLFLVSPLINTYLSGITLVKRLLLLMSLGIPAVCLGMLSDDASLFYGKNILNFMFLYVLGDTLRAYNSIWKKCSGVNIIIIWVAINILLMAFYYVTGVLFRLYYAYCSPVLIANAVLFFTIFEKMKFQNHLVNYISSSMFAVYLIHSEPTVLNKIIIPILGFLYDTSSSFGFYVIELVIYSLLIMLVSICVDKALGVVWRRSEFLVKIIDFCFGKIICRLRTLEGKTNNII